MKKKILAIICVLAIVLSTLALAFNSVAATFRQIDLDVLYETATVGEEDMVWYSYTPQVSGVYSFVSYSTGKSKAYLYTMETDEFGIRSYKGLAFADASDPNYMDEDVRTFTYNNKSYTHSATAFRLTYHLDAGTTYYYSAGWTVNSQASGTMRVRLKADSYDTSALKSVTASCSATLTAYTDGEWKTDINGKNYYFYNISKIIQNMVVTLHYEDGTTVTSNVGANTVDNYKINYTHNQSNIHWFSQSSSTYVSNAITITVGNVSTDYDVIIKVGSLYPATGKVCDYITGDPIQNATITIDNTRVATTNENGEFAFVYKSGYFWAFVDAPHSIKRKVLIGVNAGKANDYTLNPIGVASCDYINDGIINAKDFAYIKKLPSSQQEKAKQSFNGTINFKQSSYPSLSLI